MGTVKKHEVGKMYISCSCIMHDNLFLATGVFVCLQRVENYGRCHNNARLF